MPKKRVSFLFRVLKKGLRLCYPKIRVYGTEHLPDQAAIIVGNHAQMHGPVATELYYPHEHATWCAGEMMKLREVPHYAYHDFWSQKPWYSRWLYKVLSYIIAPLAVLIFNNADTIGVYHDMRSVSTFKATVESLRAGKHVIIFPEHDVPHNHIVSEFQQKFVDAARLYHKKAGDEVLFVPLYVAPDLRAMYFGKPIRFNAQTPIEEERERLCEYLMAEITQMAQDLPVHTVVPYRNIPRRFRPKNKEVDDEKTGC